VNKTGYVRSALLLFSFLAVVLSSVLIVQQITRSNVSAAGYAPAIDGVPVAGPALTLTPGVPILIDASEPAALQKAAADLQRDMKSVLGQSSPIVNTVAELGGRPAIIVTNQGAATAQFRDSSLTGEEAHQVAVRTVAGQNYAVLQGVDLRGSLYAVYTFSDKFVGVPPLWYWSEWQPEMKSSIIIASNGGVRVGTPQTKNRAWFLNNQDLWRGWDPLADKYDNLFETMLRLKLNTMYVGEQLGEYGGPSLSIAQGAQSRGLKIAANNLAQFRQWDNYWSNIRNMSQPPELSLANQAMYEDFWRFSLQFAKDKGLDVTWVLGFRGDRDGGFWDAMPDAPTSPTARGDIIEQQVARQASLVRQVTGNPHPEMAFLVWNELSDLAVQGALQLPVDSDITWIFSNHIRDHVPLSDVRTYSLPSTQPIGYYMNLQFYSTGSHLAEGEGPWKMAQNFKVVQNRRPSGPVDFAYVNMGNVREFLLTGSASARMMWNINAYSPDADMPLLMGRYFGEQNGSAAATLYRSMLAGYWQQEKSTTTDVEREHIFQDLRVSIAIDKQLDQIIAGKRNLDPFSSSLGINVADSGTQSQVGAVMNGSKASQEAFKQAAAAIDAKLAEIPASQRVFYKDTLQSPAQFLYQAHRTLYTVTRSHFKIESDKPAAYCSLLDAKGAATAMRTALNQSAHGEFASWYTGESLFGLDEIQEKIESGLRTLPAVACSGDPLAPTPPAVNMGDLVVKRFVLTNSQGVEKTTFAPGEAIYPKVILANQGTATVDTPSNSTYTQFYSNAANTVAKGTASDVNVSLQNGEFAAGFEKEYGASGVGPNGSFYKNAKSWTKSQTGTFTARAYINYVEDGQESSFTNNQLTASYTVASTPVPQPEPEPQPQQYSVNAYSSVTGLKTSSARDSKRTVFRAMRTMNLNQLSCYGCGANTSFVLRKSSSSFSYGTQIYSGTTQGTNGPWSYVNVNIPVTGGHYYILEFLPSTLPVYFGSTAAVHPDFQFLKYATTGAPTWKTGSWEVGLSYTK